MRSKENPNPVQKCDLHCFYAYSLTGGFQRSSKRSVKDSEKSKENPKAVAGENEQQESAATDGTEVNAEEDTQPTEVKEKHEEATDHP